MIGNSYPFRDIAKQYGLPYEVVLHLADGIKKEQERPVWHAQAMTHLTQYVGNAVWKDNDEDIPLVQRRADLMSEILNTIDDHLRKHHGLPPRKT